MMDQTSRLMFSWDLQIWIWKVQNSWVSYLVFVSINKYLTSYLFEYQLGRPFLIRIWYILLFLIL